MTLLQLKYAVTVAGVGSITEAAGRLYISQPSLTNAIKELEKEMNIKIFIRSNKGVVVSKEGEVFLGYARQVLEQAALLTGRYCGGKAWGRSFCVSTQHYSFAVNAFVDLIQRYGGDEYDFNLRETQTYEIIEDVALMKSEVGVLYINSDNETVLSKLFRERELEFTELTAVKPHVFVGKNNPLAGREYVTWDDLSDCPYLSFEQGEHNSFYFSEEIFGHVVHKKNIRVRDRATLFNLLIGLDGYTISSGIIDEKLNGSDIVAVPLNEEGDMHIGCITHKKLSLSYLAQEYVSALKRCLA